MAELLPLNFIIKGIIGQNSAVSNYLICTSYISSLETLRLVHSSSNIIVEIKRLLKDLKNENISVVFTIFRGHMGVIKNERANIFAKITSKREIGNIFNFPKPFYKKAMNEST